MDEDTTLTRAVELLEELGLKQYEARCFVALTRMEDGTARDVSDVSEVPRTRVYEATDSLESRGLVEVQHSQPQRFRAIPIEEAVEVLRNQYEDRVASLQDALERTSPVSGPDDDQESQVWQLSGRDAVSTRTRGLIEEATEEVVFVVDHDDVCEPPVLESLESAASAGVSVVVGDLDGGPPEWADDVVPAGDVLTEELDWLHNGVDDERLRRIVVADRESMLVSVGRADSSGDGEAAVFSAGGTNGLLLIVRRALASHLG